MIWKPPPFVYIIHVCNQTNSGQIFLWTDLCKRILGVISLILNDHLGFTQPSPLAQPFTCTKELKLHQEKALRIKTQEELLKTSAFKISFALPYSSCFVPDCQVAIFNGLNETRRGLKTNQRFSRWLSFNVFETYATQLGSWNEQDPRTVLEKSKPKKEGSSSNRQFSGAMNPVVSWERDSPDPILWPEDGIETINPAG